MQKQIKCLVAVLGMLGITDAAFAHHSFAAIFDPSKEMSVEGTLAKVDWINPHSYFHVMVLNPDHTTTTWDFEGFPPAMLRGLGLSSDKFTTNVGKKVKVTFNPALKAGEHLGYGRVYEFDGGPRIEFTPPST
jgi:Family of unknown function (DUF6152)